MIPARLSIEEWKIPGFCHSPVDFRAYSRAYPRLPPLTPTHADAQISMGESQIPLLFYLHQGPQGKITVLIKHHLSYYRLAEH